MTYDKTGSVIDHWAKRRQLRLMIEPEAPRRRYFYASSDKGETFQVVVEPERGGSVRMDAHLIESLGDEEAHFMWKVPESQTEHALDLSLESIQTWFKRTET